MFKIQFLFTANSNETDKNNNCSLQSLFKQAEKEDAFRRYLDCHNIRPWHIVLIVLGVSLSGVFCCNVCCAICCIKKVKVSKRKMPSSTKEAELRSNLQSYQDYYDNRRKILPYQEPSHSPTSPPKKSEKIKITSLG